MRSKTANVFLVLTFAFSATALAPDPNLLPVNITIKSAEGNFAPVSGVTYELVFDKEIPWTDSNGANNSDDAAVEFSSGQPKTLSCELLFDTYKKREDVTGTGPSQLLKLADADPALKRPPMVTFTWGPGKNTFNGVIQTVGVKYTMFLPDGTPCRATVNLKVKEASKASFKKKD